MDAIGVAEAAHGGSGSGSGSGGGSGGVGAKMMDVLRAYESNFEGRILDERGCACVASWPGVYAKKW